MTEKLPVMEFDKTNQICFIVVSSMVADLPWVNFMDDKRSQSKPERVQRLVDPE